MVEITYFEYLQQCFNHAKDKLPDSYTVDDVAIHVLKAESHSSPEYDSKEQTLAWFRFFKWIKPANKKSSKKLERELSGLKA